MTKQQFTEIAIRCEKTQTALNTGDTETISDFIVKALEDIYALMEYVVELESDLFECIDIIDEKYED
jgi:tRNA 2-selenouridine synthase SelU